MSRYDGPESFRRLVNLAIGLALATFVAGCFQPLYGDRSPTGGSAVRESLGAVEVQTIPAPPNSPEARVAVQLQNGLRFNFTGGNASQRPTHRLAVQISGSRMNVSASTVTGLPVNENFVLHATYTLVEVATGKAVVTGRAITTVSYDPAGTQRFSRITGLMDAERRAAKEIADNLTTRVAAYFVSGG